MPKLGLQPKPFGEACYFWQGGDFIKNDEPQGNQVFCQMNECIPEVVKAMRACIKETGSSKLFSANITADDPNEMIARGKYVLSQFSPLSENCAFLVAGYVAGGTAVTCARRNFPQQFLHYHRAGHGSVTSLRLSVVTRPHQDLLYHRCFWHPRGRHELWQDGGRCVGQEHCLHTAG